MTTPPIVNDIFPESTGGPIESVKTAIIFALRESLLGTTVEDESSLVRSIDLEYPVKKEHYPGIWVGFSFTKLVPSGIAHELMHKNTDDPEWTNWEPVREWMFEGRISLTIVALSSLQRDRISDAFVAMFSFSRPPAGVITNESRDTKQYRQLLTALQENPYISMSINSDQLIIGGQNTNYGAPWDKEQQTTYVYEDLYSFDVLGQFGIIFQNDGTYTVRKVEWKGEMWDPHEWH